MEVVPVRQKSSTMKGMTVAMDIPEHIHGPLRAPVLMALKRGLVIIAPLFVPAPREIRMYIMRTALTKIMKVALLIHLTGSALRESLTGEIQL